MWTLLMSPFIFKPSVIYNSRPCWGDLGKLPGVADAKLGLPPPALPLPLTPEVPCTVS